VALDDLRYISLYGDCSIVLRVTKKRSLPDMSVDKFIRNPLWATLVGALVAAMVVSVVVFVQSGEAAPQAADEQTPYASVSPKSPMIVGGTAVPNGKYPFMAALLACVLSTRVLGWIQSPSQNFLSRCLREDSGGLLDGRIALGPS
jgi:hypothetical protein